jgi:S-DNA-T family DNA segregation ATPase FtsK/SpoIIIE
MFADIGRMPHLLVAGATGTGKTICLNSLIVNLLYRNSPDVLKLILVDPKRVEFPIYQEIPHLLCPVICDASKTVIMFRWLTLEMERRFRVLAEAKTRDIGAYNELQMKKEEKLMPYITVVVDELADLMMARGKEIEAGIVRIAQMARAVGIHLVIATQRPSVEVITGLIKANITSRISFQVASQIDSRTVLDTSGAEKLLGNGDLLYITPDNGRPRRLQGSFVSDAEIKSVVDFVKDQDVAIIESINFEVKQGIGSTNGEVNSSGGGMIDFNKFGEDEDEKYSEAVDLVKQYQKASTSLLQRRLGLGYGRAAKIIDLMEERGIVGPANGAKPREVFVQGDNPVSLPVEDEIDNGLGL